MLKKLPGAVVFSAVLLAGLPVVTRATTVERLTIEDLAARSQTIIQGTVRESRSYWSPNGKLILTNTTIEISETLKGQTTRTVEVTTVGGRIGDTVLYVGGMPAFVPGESTIVFAERTNGLLTVLGMSQGKFTVSNGEVANSPSELSFPDGRPARPTRMPLQTFKSRIRSMLEDPRSMVDRER